MGVKQAAEEEEEEEINLIRNLFDLTARALIVLAPPSAP